MIPNSDQLRSLRLALQTSPDNVPLRQLIAEMLLSMGEAEEAVLEFKTAIASRDRIKPMLVPLEKAWAVDSFVCNRLGLHTVPVRKPHQRPSAKGG